MTTQGPVHMTYDPVAGAAYLYLAGEIRHGESTKQVLALDGQVVFDLDAEGKILGIEFISSSLLRAVTLTGAKEIR